jgi:predicted amidohydrolase
MKITISLGQMDIRSARPNDNEEIATTWIVEAVHRGSDLILFPELWSTGVNLENCLSYAAGLDEGIFNRIAHLARINHISIGGSLLEKKDSQLYNTFAFFGADGSILAAYRKTHLFRPMYEDKWLCAGNALVVSQAPWGPTGLAICYDLRFPEVFRFHAINNASLILIPAEWPTARIEHWQILLRARAIENQLFIAATNRAGCDNNEAFGGHSAVIDPWGHVIIEGQSDPILLTTEIDLAEVNRARLNFPILEDLRTDIYGRI